MNFFMAKWSAAALVPLLMFAGSSWTQAQRDDLKTIRGKVARFTEAPKGEVDGLELSDGTVVHWPPHLERNYTFLVKKGDRIRVVGREETKPKGEKVLEARNISNLETGTSDEAATALGTRGTNDEIEQRLRAIEDKLDALLKRMK